MPVDFRQSQSGCLVASLMCGQKAISMAAAETEAVMAGNMGLSALINEVGEFLTIDEGLRPFPGSCKVISVTDIRSRDEGLSRTGKYDYPALLRHAWP